MTFGGTHAEEALWEQGTVREGKTCWETDNLVLSPGSLTLLGITLSMLLNLSEFLLLRLQNGNDNNTLSDYFTGLGEGKCFVNLKAGI